MPTKLSEAKIYDPYDAYLFSTGDDRFKNAQLTDKINSSGNNLQDFIFDTAPGDFIKDEVSIPLGLNENQSKSLAIIVLELILADFYLGNVVKTIQERLNIDELKAKTIAGLILTKLFAPILEDLKKIHIDKFARGQSVQQSNQAPMQNDDRVVNLKNQ